MRRVLVQTNAHKTPPGQRIRHPPRTPVPGRIELRASALDKLVEDLRLQQPVQLLVKRMPRRTGQLRVRDPQFLLLLPLLPRPHRHAPILQTNPLHSSEPSAYESGLAPRAVRGVQRGYFSFQRERSEIMKADGLLISAEELPWRNPISACRSRLNE